MKICPKCDTQHNKNGTFCSRACANSRQFSVAAKLKKSKANKSFWKSVSQEEREMRRVRLAEYNRSQEKRDAVRSTWLQKQGWDGLSWETKRRLVKEDQNQTCDKCKLDTWLGLPITLEVDHINGIGDDDRRENLVALCPNCHSQTESWRGRNKPSKNGESVVTDELMMEALKENKNIRQALLSLGLAAKGSNYKRAKKLIAYLA